MPRSLTVLVLLAALLGPRTGLSASTPDWSKLQPGMSQADAAQKLGEPLVRTSGRGFELWIYDGEGEALFAGGPLKYWTAGQPSAASLARPVASDVLIRPVRTRRLPRLQELPVPVEYFREISTSRFRYR